MEAQQGVLCLTCPQTSHLPILQQSLVWCQLMDLYLEPKYHKIQRQLNLMLLKKSHRLGTWQIFSHISSQPAFSWKLRARSKLSPSDHTIKVSCCFWYAVSGWIFDSSRREPETGRINSYVKVNNSTICKSGTSFQTQKIKQKSEISWGKM